MLLRIAWRNIWRNKRRSIIVLTSIIVGIIATIMLDGLTNGMLEQMLHNQVNSGVTHIQIHRKGFSDNKNVKSYLPDSRKVEEIVKTSPLIKHYGKRVVTFGLLSSAANSSGVYINGIVPPEEANITNIKTFVKEGSYPGSDGREILISKDLAEKLDVGLGSKVVALSNTPDGSVGSDVFRVTGIYETFSSDFDRINVYIPLERAQQLLNIGDEIHEIAVIAADDSRVMELKDQISGSLTGDYEVLSYTDLLPLLVMFLDMYGQMTWIINLIVGLALIFGIINVMQMAVFERIREFGVLMSIGMKNSKLFFMVIVESFIIGIIGTALGISMGILIQTPLQSTGIDLSMFAESLKSYGVGAVIYPVTSADNLLSLAVMIPFISAAAAIYPAYKAMKLEPVYAIRYV
jgi:ABC-type lipoprotein release transport system permease subunit